jgi:hypothetical protein
VRIECLCVRVCCVCLSYYYTITIEYSVNP